MYVSTREKDWNEVIECLPQLVTGCNSVIKIMSLHLNRRDLKEIYVSVKAEWELLKHSGEVHILEGITKTGNKIALLYRNTLLFFLVIFIMLPLLNPMLDIVAPLNETRQRIKMFKVYYFVNDDQYFYLTYLHAAIYSVAVVLMIVSVDSLYMMITHHAAGLFAVCKYKFVKLTERKEIGRGIAAEDGAYEEAIRCVEAHNKAFKFVEFLHNMNRKNILLQVGFNMIGISITAFQAAMHLGELDQVMRYGIFWVAQNFHLFYNSLPGQIISDLSSEIANGLYNSNWYETHVKIQKLILISQMRSSKPYEMTAGGIYKMNIETFGMTFKTCMSYFTMLLSMQE